MDEAQADVKKRWEVLEEMAGDGNGQPHQPKTLS
jgi:hypothetical protein